MTNLIAMHNKRFLSGRWRSVILVMLLAQVQNAYSQADKVLNTPVTNAQNITATHSITLNPGFSADGANGVVTLSIIGAPVQNCVPLAATPSADRNYVMTLTPRQPFGIGELPNLTSKNTCEVMQTIQYFDGLGRPLQTVQVKGNPDATADVVQPFAYDQYGREAVKYLPYTTASGIAGSYRADALTGTSGYSNSSQNSFYQLTGQNYAHIDVPSAATIFEPSPLNRPIEQGAPGTDWQPGAHTIKTGYGSNDATSVSAGTGHWARLYSVDIDANGNRTLNDHGTGYGANELYVTTLYDENWQNGQTFPKNHTTEEYKDQEGHVVVKRTFNDSEILSTYYVYDDFGDLSFVLPPKAEPDAGGISQATLDNLCYQYEYDERQRLIEKRIPGKGSEYIVYNTLDQVVLTQDANQRSASPQTWTFTKYDALGRVIMTGIYADNLHSSQGTNSFRAAYQTIANGYGALWEGLASGGNGYTNNAIPQGSIPTYLTINYYDDYTFPSGNPSYPYVQNTDIIDMPASASTMTKGLLTASKVNVLGTNDMLWTVNYYDDKGRDIQSNTQHYLGGGLNPGNHDEISNGYDFTNAVTRTIRKHYVGGANTLNIADSIVYDHMGRKRQTWNKVNNVNKVLLSQIDYNEVGQALNKHLHSTNSGASFLQDIGYTYNERGWLTNQSSTKLTLYLAYNNGITTGATPQYNGNIAEMYTTSDHTSANSKFKYTYDPLNRLIAADHSNGTLTENGITYDKMGNIVDLARTGAGAKILHYTYTGNQLTSVTDNLSPFRIYSYDGNGNATTDGGSKNISYNLLNLPETVTQNTTTLATYTYEANGTKVKNTGTDGTWDYVSGIVYHNGSIAFIGTAEVRAIPNAGSFSYQYDLKDHLGNTRVSMDNTGVLQEDEYYAFGLRNPKYDNSNNNRYLYNGKEIQTDLANQYDYGARFYDPVIGRWGVPDPMAEVATNWTPYRYGFDNPIRNTDPNGMLEFGNNSSHNEDSFKPMQHHYIAGWFHKGNKYRWDDRVNNDAEAVRYHGKGATFVPTSNAKLYTYTAANKYQYYLGPGGRNDFGRTYSEMKQNPTGGQQSYQEWADKFQATIRMADPVLHGMEIMGNIEAGVLTGGLGSLASEAAQMVAISQSFGEVSTATSIVTTTAEGTHSVYQGVDAAGVVRYIGITGRDFAIREAEHLASGTARAGLRYSVIEGATGLTKDAARVMEQNLINSNGLGNLLNKINSIAPKNWAQFGVNPL